MSQTTWPAASDLPGERRDQAAADRLVVGAVAERQVLQHLGVFVRVMALAGLLAEGSAAKGCWMLRAASRPTNKAGLVVTNMTTLVRYC